MTKPAAVTTALIAAAGALRRHQHGGLFHPLAVHRTGADHYVFEGFELIGGSFRCLYHQAADLLARDLHIHHCPAHGVLGAHQGSGSLTLEYSEIDHCGAGTNQHQIYMGTGEENRPGSVFRLQFCYIHDGNGGNNVKSRAERNEIYYN